LSTYVCRQGVDVTQKRRDGFLSDTHRKVLTGEFDGADSTLRTHKSEIRKRSKAALRDLVDVANSPEIENESTVDGDRLFEPSGDLNVLLSSVLNPGGLVSHTVDGPSEAYQHEVYVEADTVLSQLRDDETWAATQNPEEQTRVAAADRSDSPTKCHLCGHEWSYSGSAQKATCPNCSRKTDVGKQ
jgi:hypothetical protein